MLFPDLGEVFCRTQFFGAEMRVRDTMAVGTAMICPMKVEMKQDQGCMALLAVY